MAKFKVQKLNSIRGVGACKIEARRVVIQVFDELEDFFISSFPDNDQVIDVSFEKYKDGNPGLIIVNKIFLELPHIYVWES